MPSVSTPATDDSFLDREGELARLAVAADSAASGNPHWLALIGPRKVGKTSLLLTAASRLRAEGRRWLTLDASEAEPISAELFRTLALRAVDLAFAPELDASAEALAREPGEFRSAVARTPSFPRLDGPTARLVLDLPECRMDRAALAACVDLPEVLAHALGGHFVVAIDEFQEILRVRKAGSAIDPVALLRARWQRHRRVAYVISGSARRVLTDLVTSEHSPFFQHFELMDLGGLPASDAERLVRRCAPSATPDEHRRTAELLGGHPFYLQVVGDALEHTGTLAEATQESLFHRTGRLGLYFERLRADAVGRSPAQALALEFMAAGPANLSEIARHMKASASVAAHAIERLGEVAIRDPDGRWRLVDPVFALWVRWRGPGGTSLPMKLLGDEGEGVAAEALARLGFELVFYARASRGAFDLLAVRGAVHLGVQVRRRALPLRFTKEEWGRMEAEGGRLGWRWVVAAVDGPRTAFLDPALARHGREVRLHDEARISRLRTWAGV